MRRITKLLSANDCGIKNHQSGILIPRNPSHILEFFPKLAEETLNPRLVLIFQDSRTKELLHLNFIHYNNKFFGKTRNEYRLTGISKFLRTNGARPGDLLHIIDYNGKFLLELEKTQHQTNKIRLSEGWQ